MADDDKAPEKPADTDGGADLQKEIDKWKALARKHEDQAKANKAELDKLVAAGDASKSDTEKMAAELAALRARADEADARALRAEVAQAKGLTPAQAKRLQGATKEELEADADELLQAFKPADSDDGADSESGSARKPASTRPRENLRPGATPPSDSGDSYDSKSFLAAVPRG